ncbi:hypothetical protein SDC9_200986 [bioreactor metagenome]|uniref:Uncharacterized protein n=1 Tax=bioreactor metagenome TaxID=1076179 RepID=A0A645IR01_9ZZZZ
MRFRQRVAIDSHLFKECPPCIVEMVGYLLDHSLRENGIILPFSDIHSPALYKLGSQVLAQQLVLILVLSK